VSVPVVGQRFSGILPPNSQHIKITSFHNLLSDTGEEGTELALDKAAAGTTKVKTGGKFAPEITMTEAGVMLTRVGNSASAIIDGAQGKWLCSFKETSLTTAGNTTTRNYTPKDSVLNVPHVASYLFCQEKYKDINFVSDKFQDTETPLMMPGILPYIDKAVVRAGYIKGENPVEDLGHIYEIRTQQSHTDG
tara:strand:+ start:741 stop:1316 length:576 start_codon:yes stop_codon:yes gene_type:complete